MTKPPNEYGLLIEPTNHYGTDYVEVRVVRKEPGRDTPLGCSSNGESFYSDGCPKHMLGLDLDGLGMYGFVSDSSDHEFIGYDVEYRNVHSMEERKLRRMLKTINRIAIRIAKDEAREPGDKFASFAAALKLTFAVVPLKRGSGYDTSTWRWLSIAEGRNYYRHLIDKAVVARKEKEIA